MDADCRVPAADRHVVAVALARILADTAVLAAKIQGFRWNACGTAALLLDGVLLAQQQDLQQALEALARRLRVLEHPAPGSCADLLALTGLAEERGVPAALRMAAQLSADHAAIAAAIRCVRVAIEDIGDAAAVRLLDHRLAMHEEAAALLARLEALAWSDGPGTGSILARLEQEGGLEVE